MENALTDVIGRVNATDGDDHGGRNWKVQYHISEGDPNSHFAITTDPINNQGILSVIKVSVIDVGEITRCFRMVYLYVYVYLTGLIYHLNTKICTWVGNQLICCILLPSCGRLVYMQRPPFLVEQST